MIIKDKKVPFPAFFVKFKTKTEQRRFVALHATYWVRCMHKMGRTEGAIVLDIDDTILDGHECVQNGFEYMRDFVDDLSKIYPLHIVTARPSDDRTNVMKMLHERRFMIPPDRLWMLPADQYGKDLSFVEKFKSSACEKISKMHNGLILRAGDKLWDVAHLETLKNGLSHVQEKDCYIFMDPFQSTTISCKLPGV